MKMTQVFAVVEVEDQVGEVEEDVVEEEEDLPVVEVTSRVMVVKAAAGRRPNSSKLGAVNRVVLWRREQTRTRRLNRQIRPIHQVELLCQQLG